MRSLGGSNFVTPCFLAGDDTPGPPCRGERALGRRRRRRRRKVYSMYGQATNERRGE